MKVNKTILVIDDDVDVLSIYRATIQSDGYTVVTKPNAVTAMYWMEQSQPDLIILDIMMPGLSGADFLDKIRQTPNGESVPVIIVTASQQWTEMDFVDYEGVQLIHKPIAPADLIRRIGDVLGEQDSYPG